MKTNELVGAALDWAVAKCEKPEWLGNQAEVYVLKAGFHPSTDWAQGGKIIERERIEIVPNDMWDAYKEGQHLPNTGATPLIAAMRCYVASKLGEVIDVPTEFI
jgi:hypothetical protein